MRSFPGYPARCLSTLLRRKGNKSISRALLLLAAMVGGGLALAGDSTKIEAREYSAYSDPEKPALSFILSEEQNVEEFQEEFGLGDEEMDDVLAAVREENGVLAGTYEESERIVEANEELPDERVRKKIAAAGYGAEVRAAVAETKSDLEALLPEDRRSDLEPWVDEQWRQGVGEYQASEDAAYTASARSLTCKVFATQYRGYTAREVALPHRDLKLRGGYRVRLATRIGGDWHRTRAVVREVGPWNTYDDYWERPRHRDMWRSLPRCTPEAAAAFFNNYNGGKDEQGREVLNPAGVDLTPRVARRLGLKRLQNHWVSVSYPWVRW